jgi:hypothetical protein
MVGAPGGDPADGVVPDDRSGLVVRSGPEHDGEPGGRVGGEVVGVSIADELQGAAVALGVADGDAVGSEVLLPCLFELCDHGLVLSSGAGGGVECDGVGVVEYDGAARRSRVGATRR